jgi:hypothetical protein
MRLLDLFCGRWGWSRAFAARGWECVGVDLVRPECIPERCEFVKMDVLSIKTIGPTSFYYGFDFICASPPCEQFSVHCMKFLKKKEHPYPALGIKLFNHTRQLCEDSGLSYVIENVRCAEQFVGKAVHHANAFYLWGNSVPPILPKGFLKMGNQGGYYKKNAPNGFVHDPPGRRQPTAKSATIPPELANCVADYAERILESRELEAVADGDNAK